MNERHDKDPYEALLDVLGVEPAPKLLEALQTMYASGFNQPSPTLLQNSQVANCLLKRYEELVELENSSGYSKGILVKGTTHTLATAVIECLRDYLSMLEDELNLPHDD